MKKKFKYQVNDVVIAVQKSKYAPDNVVTGFIYKFVDNDEWAEIMDDDGQIKLVEVANIRELLSKPNKKSFDEVDESPSVEEESEHGDAANNDKNVLNVGEWKESDLIYPLNVEKVGENPAEETYDPELDESINDEDDSDIKQTKLEELVDEAERIINEIKEEIKIINL